MSRIRVTVDGVMYDLDDMTLDEACSFEAATGASWARMNPTTSALHCRAVLVELYARTRSHDEAEKVVGALTSRQAVDHIDLVDADDDRPVEHNDGIPVVDPKAEPVAPVTT